MRISDMKYSGKIWDWLAVLATVLFLLLLGLRSTDVIDCSYLYVFLPIIIYFSLIALVLIASVLFVIVESCIDYLNKRKGKRKR